MKRSAKSAALQALLLILVASTAMADTRDEEIRLLREQVRLLAERLDKLEGASRSPAATAQAPDTLAADESAQADLDARIDLAVTEQVAAKLGAASWAERTRWTGDVRYRFEHIEAEDAADRDRSRIRARTQLLSQVSDTMKVGIGLATGSADPVSANQTLGNGGSSKEINLDLAFFEWTGIADTAIVAGKFSNPLYRPGISNLMWDSDWRPEGVSFNYDNGTLFALGIGTWLESDSNKLQQEFSFGAQGGFSIPFGNDMTLTTGAGYFEFDTAGKPSFFGDGAFYGNSFDPASRTYLLNYQELQAFAEISLSLLDRPLVLFGDYVYNSAADDDNTGYAVGASYGEARSRGDWKISYMYKRLEADAVLGLLTDSNFGGGGTDASGSRFAGTYAFDDNWNFQLTYLRNETGLSAGNRRDYDRLQLDLSVRFK